MTGRRGWPVLVVVAVLGVALTGVTLVVVRRTEVRLLSARLEESATSRAELLKRELDEAVLAVRGVARVIETVGPPERARFSALAAPFLQHLPEIQAIEWLPRVERPDRARFEAALRRELGPGFEITDQPEHGPRIRAGDRDVYFPVLLAEPLAPNLTAVGFDVASSAPRRQALEWARDNGEPAASEAIRLVQHAGRDHDVGVLVFVPVFRAGLPVRTVAERRTALLGYCVAVIHVEAMVAAAIVPTPASGLGIDLVDGTDAGRPRLHRWAPRLPTPPRWTRLLHPEPPHVVRAIPFLNRRWEAEFSVAPSYVATIPWQWHWLVPPVGLFVTALVCLNMARGITERQRLERLVHARTAALAVSEQRYRSIFENASEGIFQTSRGGRILNANLAFARMLGWESPDAVMAGIEDLGAQLYVDPGERARVLDRVEREGRILEVEVECRRRDGEHIHLALNMHAVRDAAGALEYFEGTTTDVTARRRSEEALRQSQANLAALMESTTEMIWSVDRDERLVTFNHAFAKYCRSTYGVEVHPGIHGKQHLPPEAYAIWSQLYQRAMQDGSFTLEHELLPDHRFLALSLHPISEDGAVTGVSVFAKDVTEQKRLADQLNQAQKMEAIGTLAGGIAHDFNNILSAIKGYSELAASRCVDPEQADDLEQVCAAVTRAAELTKQILVFSRTSTAEARPIQPKVIVKEALKLLRASLPSTIEFRQELASDSVVLADPGEIHRIVVNLCMNAAHAMEEAGGVLQVSLDDVDLDAAYVASSPDVRPGRFVRLTVKDSGCGMTEEVRSRVFEPYFTTRAEGKGTGLGLSVVHGIVSKRHGTVSVASAVGKGSTFQILLPVDAAHLATAAQAERAPAMGTERVLFVDDEPMMANLAVRSLGRLGYRVTAMTSSVDALARLRAAPQDFDVVVTDTTMPHLTGDRLATAIRAFAPSMPIILCTGFSERIDEERARDLGIDELVMKPVAGADLSHVIRRVLSVRRQSGRGVAAAPGMG